LPQKNVRVDGQGVEKAPEVVAEYRDHAVTLRQDRVGGLARRDFVDEESRRVDPQLSPVAAATPGRWASSRAMTGLAGRARGVGRKGTNPAHFERHRWAEHKAFARTWLRV